MTRNSMALVALLAMAASCGKASTPPRGDDRRSQAWDEPMTDAADQDVVEPVGDPAEEATQPHDPEAKANEAACEHLLAAAQQESEHASHFNSFGDRPDFDGDGVADCVFLDFSEAYLFAVANDNGGKDRYLGSMRADELYGVGCTGRDRGPDGYCVVWAGEHMVHGERQTTYYAWDGSTYMATGESELSERPPKFRK